MSKQMQLKAYFFTLYVYLFNMLKKLSDCSLSRDRPYKSTHLTRLSFIKIK